MSQNETLTNSITHPLFNLVVSRLLSFGADVEVLQPESVRQEHQRLIAEMSAVYSK